nr:fusion protein of alpha subunit of RNA polymerase and ribosomal protein S9 [Dinophyceae sp. MRD-151]
MTSNLHYFSNRGANNFCSFEPNHLSLFLHCVDSRLEENGSWYSRLHLGPFRSGSRLQVGARLRRSLLSDLDQISIVAIKLEGAIHEFSRLPGVRESILDILFQFRKLVLQAPFLKLGKTVIVSFLFSGSGLFFAKDIFFPEGIRCRNPEVLLVSLSPGAILRGHLLICKNQALDSSAKIDQTIHFGEPWSREFFRGTIPIVKKFQRLPISPWLSLGFQAKTIERVGFRIEPIGPLNKKREILIFEILTNGRVSPRQALREASILLVSKFLNVVQRTIPNSQNTRLLSIEKKSTRKRFFSFLDNYFIGQKQILSTEKDFYNLCKIGFSRFCEPLGIDLRNLDLAKERYRELRNLGFKTLGQLLERLAFEDNIFSPLLKKQRQLALFQLGLFPFLFIFMKDNLFFTKTVGRRKAAIANIKLVPGSGKIQVNNQKAKKFFVSYPDRFLVVEKPCSNFSHVNFDIKSKVQGGGLKKQVEAMQLALARALVVSFPRNRRIFRKNHLLTRDSREKERRKYGLKKARKAPQFSKR